MKKYFRAVCLLLSILLAAMLVACTDPGAPEYDASSPKLVKDIATNIDIELDLFLDANPDRTTFNKGEYAAAEYLCKRMKDFGATDADIVMQSFSVSEGNEKDLESQNVITKYPSKTNTLAAKNVVLGAYYDNRYSQSYSGASSVKAEAALAGGSGVATLLAIAKYIYANNIAFDFDVTFVFFGASYVYTDGAYAYVQKGMSSYERKNTVLMVELQRLGVDHVYMYSDERETKREAFFDGIARENSLDIYKPTQKSPLINISPTNGMPYFRWAHTGLICEFADFGIPTLNIVGANWETLNIGDAESASHADITYTIKDDRTTLKKYYPDYAQKMATAATLVIRSLENAEFEDIMTYDREHYPETDILTMDWVWRLVALAVLAAAALAVFSVYNHLHKKYRPAPVQPPRMKMAVFGMDYEDKTAADIFVDIKRDNEDIFPGVPNNDAPQKNSSTGIFPPVFGADRQSAAPVDPFEQASAPERAEPFEQDDEQKPAPEHVEAEKSEAKESLAQDASQPDNAEQNPTDEHAEAEKSEAKESLASDMTEERSAADAKQKASGGRKPKAKEPVIEIVKPAPKKRATVSAKKSVGAKKSNSSANNAEDKKDDGE